jgi:hypothetical protein
MTRLDVAIAWIVIEVGLLVISMQALVKDKPAGWARTISIAWIVFFAVGALVWTLDAAWNVHTGFVVH